MKKTMAALAASALLVPAAALLASGSAQAAPEDSGKTGVRAADLIPALRDVRTSGHEEFLAEGIHVWTDDNSSQAKVAEYFPVTIAGGGLPTTSKMEWFGGQPQPGVQVVFDVDSTTGNGNDFNILVGEEVYGVDGSGNYTDWWLTNGSSAAAKAAAPLTTGGSGSGWHGSLAQWKAALPGAKMAAGGFSLGSGVLNDGVIRSISFDGVSYVPTSEAKPTTPAPAQTTPTTLPAKDVTGTVKAKTPNKLRLKLNFLSDATPTGFSEGKALTYKIKVDGVLASKLTQGAKEKDVFARVFTANTGTHKVQVFKNGAKVGTFKVVTSS